jgi:glutamate-1-semialdehyde 2,1-aminomutase
MPANSPPEPTSSERLFAKARRVLAGGISHENRYAEPYPVYVRRGRGSRYWDVEGKEYVDYCMGSASLLLGHAQPDVVAAIREQAELGTFYGNCHPLEVEWGELVQEMVPSAERIRFTGSGSEATLLAIRLARAYTGKPKLLRFETHYHGWHDYAVVGTVAPYGRSPSLGLLPGVEEATVVCPADANRVEEALKRHPDVAAIICEPSGASYGTVPFPRPLIRDLRRLADTYGAVLILDEIISGFRWSPGGAQALAGIKPDLTTLAKILTGGLPGGAVAGREEIMRLLDPTVESQGRRPGVTHKGTFNGSPLAAAAGVAALKIVRTGEPQRRADAVAASVREGMQKALDEHQVAGVAYGESSTIHVYFGAAARKGVDGLSAGDIKGVPKETVTAFRRGIRERGGDLMSYLGGVASAAHTEADAARMVEIFEATVRDLVGRGLLGRR